MVWPGFGPDLVGLIHVCAVLAISTVVRSILDRLRLGRARPRKIAGYRGAFVHPSPGYGYSMFRNSASGPDFGHILVGKASKAALRLAEGRPKGRL